MMAPLRFCMVTTFYPPYNFGGDGVFVHRLSNELARRGHEVEVVHCRQAYRLLERSEPPRPMENHPGVTVHTLDSAAGMLSPLLTHQTGFPMLKAPALREILEGGAFDVIHFHNISLVGGPGVLAYGDAIKLYTMHEYWLVCAMHILFKNNRAACTSPTCVRCTLAHRRPLQPWRYTGLLQRAVQHVDAFLAPSLFAADMHAQRGLHIPTYHLPHFIPDPPGAAAAEAAVPNNGRPYFLFVGRLEKIKGLQDVIPQMAHIEGADLIIIGDGAYRATLETLAAGNPRVRFLGALPYENLAAYYAHALALLVPSLCYETFGQIVMEAFAMHIPVIARKIGALEELVTQSGGGQVFETSEQLRRIMQDVQQNPALSEAWAAQGLQYYLQHGTVELHLERYLSLIASLRAKRGALVAGA